MIGKPPAPSADRLRAVAALLAALALAAAALAAHGLSGDAQWQLLLAAAIGLLHAPALLGLATIDDVWVCRLATALILGIALFAGALGYAVAGLGAPRLAPFGGSLMIFAWLGLALRFFLRSART